MESAMAKSMAAFVGGKSTHAIREPKKMNFMEAVSETLNELPYNVSITENGAVGYKTTGKKLVDLNFATSSLRSKSERDINAMFLEAYNESPLYAWKWLFFCRDVRGGMGERRTFRTILKQMAVSHTQETAVLLPYIAEYGRYDDMWCLLETPLKKLVVQLISAQLETDMAAYKEDKPMSLLAKWLPSRRASSKETKEYAKIIIEEMGIDRILYQKTLSMLRSKLNLVETYMSSNQWSAIDYNTVPSKANLKYNSAFLRHDEERRRKFLDALKNNEKGVKINAGTLYPHDIVHKYMRSSFWSQALQPYDETLEQLWKAQKDTVNGAENVMVVADGSGSMTTQVGNSGTTALDVANALAIYFAEKASGQFANQYITFSETPQLVRFDGAKSLHDKLSIALRHNECANTNIEAVFNLIIKTALAKKMRQEDLPGTILIISDMEFDTATGHGWGFHNSRMRTPNKTLFQEIDQKFKKHNYKMPRLVFWNVNSRTGTIPVKENAAGVALVSGFSPNIMQMVLSDELDPYKCLLAQLNTERYQAIEDAFNSLKEESNGN